MKLFVSWSGNLSHQVALLIRDWLPQVINVLDPYVSSQDIKAGEQWFTSVRKELEDSSYGIICLTHDNLKQPWLLFEAGALSTRVSRARVVPLLIDISPSDLYPPLSEFQAVQCNKNGVLHLLKSLHKELEISQLNEIRLEKSFNVWYPELQKSINEAINQNSNDQVKVKPVESAKENINNYSKEKVILEEILNNTRTIMQSISDKPNYTIQDIKQQSNDQTFNTLLKSESATYSKTYSGKYSNIEKEAIDLLKRGTHPQIVINKLSNAGVPKHAIESLLQETK